MNSFSKEPSLQNKRAVNIATKMGKRYTLLDAMLMGKKLKIDWKKSKFTMGDLLVGMHYELEHGKVDADTNVTNDNALKTAKIAWAHLKERPDYYVQLMKIDPPKKMEKKASDELNDMTKEAAPRWRKEWGGLSADSQKRLQMPGQIASQANETAKRMSGQKTMMKNWGIESSTEPYGDYASNRKMRRKYNLMGPYFDGRTNRLHDHFSPGKTGEPSFKGLKMLGMAGRKNLKKIYKTDRPLYDEIQSIINGSHEIGGEALMIKQKTRHIPPFISHFSHVSPEVLHRESAAVATATPEAKKFMRNVRSIKSLAALNDMYLKGYRVFDRVSEIDELKRNGGVEYAKDAVVNARKVRKHRLA